MSPRSLLLALALVAVLIGTAAGPAAARTPRRCNGSAALCGRPFDRVVLPGAHNAMSAAQLRWQIPNQTLAIPAQLRYGIRALLIDSHYGRRQADGRVVTDDEGTATTGVRGTYLCHVACELGSTPLVRGLREIRLWLRRNPNEVLAIVHEDHVTSRDFVAAARASGLERSVYRGSTRRFPTLRAMIASGQRVVVLAEQRGGVASWYHPAYRGIVQETPYTFPTPDLLVSPAAWETSCRPNRGGRRGSLFLMNHWSPSTPPPVPDLAASARVNARRVIVGRARACARLRGRLPSIVAVDQVAAGGLLAAVRELNR